MTIGRAWRTYVLFLPFWPVSDWRVDFLIKSAYFKFNFCIRVTRVKLGGMFEWGVVTRSTILHWSTAVSHLCCLRSTLPKDDIIIKVSWKPWTGRYSQHILLQNLLASLVQPLQYFLVLEILSLARNSTKNLTWCVQKAEKQGKTNRPGKWDLKLADQMKPWLFQVIYEWNKTATGKGIVYYK